MTSSVYTNSLRLLSSVWTIKKWLFCYALYILTSTLHCNVCYLVQWKQATYNGILKLSHPSYLLTPCCRVLLEKLTGLQLVKKFPAFHGTRRSITALTSVRHLSLSWASPIQSICLHPTSWRSILILSTHLRLGLPSGLLPYGFPTKTLYTPSPDPHAPHTQLISSVLEMRNNQVELRSFGVSMILYILYCTVLYNISFLPLFKKKGNFLLTNE